MGSPNVARRVGAEDGAGLDVPRHLDQERRLEIADVLVAVGADRPHWIGIAVVGLLGEDLASWLVRLALEQGKE
jgi:hypothetical protein